MGLFHQNINEFLQWKTVKLSFYQKLFSKSNDISRQKVLQYLQDKNLPKLNDDQCDLCEKGETDEEVKNELNKMEINKSPGNDGLKKEFYEVFWDHVKVPLLLSFSPSVTLKFLSFSFCHVKVPLLPLLLSVAFLKRELSTSRK